ncbi:MAG: Do family serine endopeptidase [Candidatus Neomarinimicrobiota bacterium]|nr:Do family serine endopeptidase [Candidatus Neomarinimicrobiota bacterium]|tara:strand:+ start:823 stop:2220 length:1398 start_codon:yes stop_codon:yes gene_type:complete
MKKLFTTIFYLNIVFTQNVFLKQFSDQFADIAEKANPAVVTILTEKKVEINQSNRSTPQEDLFRFYFNQPRQREYKSSALGSGVIIDAKNGYIITNNHVVEDVDEITVRLLDKSEYKASIIGKDPKSDLAVIKIKAKGLADLELGDSDNLRVGEWVIAVGSPFSANLSHTVTAGIVSAKGRGNIIQGDIYEDFIQTDAAINPGNSGGALLNSSGDLIGINTAIYSNGYFDRGNKGVGFAIPSNMVKKVMSDLIAYGEVVRSYIGVQIQPINDTAAKALDLKTRSGALVANVIEDGPADKAGIETGDVIVEFDGMMIKSVDHLRNNVSISKPNNFYNLGVIRDGRKKSFKVKLEKMPNDDKLALNVQTENSNELGIEVSNLNRLNRQEFGINSQDAGIIVTRVLSDSPSDEAGIQAGDLITRVGSRRCRTIKEFDALVKNTKRRGMLMLHIKRDGNAQYVTLDLKK